MTETLQYVVDALERLPEVEQREIAERIAVELFHNVEQDDAVVQVTSQVEVTGRADWP